MKKFYLLTVITLLINVVTSYGQLTKNLDDEVEGILNINETEQAVSPVFYSLETTLKNDEIHVIDSLTKGERSFIEFSTEPLAIGVVREMKAALNFRLFKNHIPESGAVEYAGGRLSRINADTLVFTTRIQSKGADEIRFFISEGYFPQGVQLNIFGPNDYAFTQRELSGVLDEYGFYTTTCFGDYAFIQLVIPKHLFGSGIYFTISKVVHAENKYLPESKATCYQDANCSYANGFSYITNLKRATARLSFPVGSGYYQCSGGLIADNRTSDIQPFLLTANHCFSTQASATGLEARFDFWSTSCGSSSTNPNVYIVSGANLIKTNSQTDFTLVLLKAKPGGTRYYLGWTTSNVANGATLHSVNHPAGTFQKYTRQQNKTTPTYNCSGFSTSYYHYTTALGGQTAGGSSGGVIVNASNQVVGQLYGNCHPTTWDWCSYSTYNNVWGKFASSYSNNNLQYWLNNGGASVKITSPTALSFDSIVVGNSKTLTITVTNSGTVPNYLNLEAGSISISGANASEFSIIGTTFLYLAPGASGNFNIRFTPSSAGNKTATLNIPHNANNVASPRTVTLTGIGKNPIPTYSVTTMPNPFIAGLTIGDGIYQHGSTVFLQAIENYGYVFENWTENGTIVSTDMQFSFIISSNRYFVANFLCIMAAPAGVISGNTQVCQGESSVVYTVSQIPYADFYEWTLPSGAIVNSTTNSISVDFATNDSSGYISVRGVNACGSGSESSLAITVSPLPATAGPISGNTQFCQGENAVVYTVSQIPNADFYEWSLPTGATGSSATNTISIDFANNAASGYISVKGVNTCGKGLRSSLAITANLMPEHAGPIYGNTQVCQGENDVVYTVSQIPNADFYEWTLPSGAVGSSSTQSITLDFANNATTAYLSVKGVNACGEGTASGIAVIVMPLPVPPGPISGNAQLCQGQSTLVYSVSQIPYADFYEWTLPSGATGSSTTQSISLDFGNNAVSGNISVKGVNACGEGSESSLAVTVNPLPESADLISGITQVCVGESGVFYLVLQIPYADSYEWTLPTGVSGSSTSNNILLDFGANAVSGNISVKGVNACGEGSESSLAITVNSLPEAAAPVSGYAQVCQGESYVMYDVPQILGADFYEWTLPAGVVGSSTSNYILLDFGANAVSGYVSVKGVNACGEGTESVLAVTVNPLPEAAGPITGNVEVCKGENGVLYSVSQIANADFYEWTLPAGASGNYSANNIFLDFTSNAMSGYISVKGLNDCGWGSESILAVTVNTLPEAAGPITGSTQVCQGENAVVYAVLQIPNADYYEWVLPSGVSGSSLSNTISVDFGNSALSGNISVKGVNACGESNESIMEVDVNSLPDAAFTITGVNTVCEGETGLIFNVPLINNADTYVWSIPTGASGNSTNNTIVVAFGTGALSGQLSVCGQNACGVGIASEFHVTVNIKPPTPYITLYGNILTSDALLGNQWYNQDGLINGAVNPNYTADVSGDYFVMVELSGCKSDTSNIVNVVISASGNLSSDVSILVYPNPFIGELFLEIGNNTAWVDFEIYSANGQMIYKNKVKDKVLVPASNMPTGVYFIRLYIGDTAKIVRVVKE